MPTTENNTKKTAGFPAVAKKLSTKNSCEDPDK